jgi:hypothetical protein
MPAELTTSHDPTGSRTLTEAGVLPRLLAQTLAADDEQERTSILLLRDEVSSLGAPLRRNARC